MTPGFRIKLHHALIEPILFAGVPRRFAILNGTICAALVLGLHAIYILPISVIIHIAAMVATRKDPYFFDVALRHLRQKRFYDV
jgi:type IV secretion system protein VirB3